jgi:hypothetical protein
MGEMTGYIVFNRISLGLGLWCLMPLSTILYRVGTGDRREHHNTVINTWRRVI